MGNVLGLTKDQAVQRLQSLTDELFELYNIPYKLNERVSILDGVTYNNDDGYAVSSEIGLFEIEQARGKIFNRRNPIISDMDFTRVIVNIFHEQMHHTQKNELFRQRQLSDCVDKQLIQEIACRENPDYYIHDGNYKINSNEIQAEAHGVSCAYQYLCDKFPRLSNEQCENIIVDLVNDKAKNSSYFIQKRNGFQSLQEINDAFDKAYDNSFSKNRYYYVNARNTQDVVKLYMQEYPNIKNMYLSLSLPCEKDKYIAAVNLQLHPNWKESYYSLENRDLYHELSMNNKLSVRSKAVESEFPELFDTFEDCGHNGFE